MLNKDNLIQWKDDQQELEKLQQELEPKREKFQEEVKKLSEKYEEDNKELIESITKLTDMQYSMKEILKQNAVDMYKNDNTIGKKLIGGIGIRVGVTLLYEPDKAFEWAKEHSLALSLDKKRFEQLAKTENIDFVKKEDKITATFPKELKIN